MAKVISFSNWFTRTTGRPVFHYRNCDCECHSYSRPFCFNCTREFDRPESGQPQSKVLEFMQKPSWWDRLQKTHLTDKDVEFLTGWKPYRRGAYAG